MVSFDRTARATIRASRTCSCREKRRSPPTVSISSAVNTALTTSARWWAYGTPNSKISTSSSTCRSSIVNRWEPGRWAPIWAISRDARTAAPERASWITARSRYCCPLDMAATRSMSVCRNSPAMTLGCESMAPPAFHWPMTASTTATTTPGKSHGSCATITTSSRSAYPAWC
ncbi:hypothetical protein D3C71_1560260 [compost metagenome]